jgi:carboxylesterase
MLVAILLALIVALLAMSSISRRNASRLRDDTLRRLPVGPDGIIPGAEAFALEHGPDAPAVLLLHGGGDTPQTLRYFAEYLFARGYSVRVPLLPGHGRTLHEFSAVVADAWIDSARTAYREMTASHRWVALGGLSMGGALAAQLAAEQRSLPALALLAPYFAMPTRIAMAARLSALWGPAVPYVRAVDRSAAQSIHNEAEAARSLGYGVFTPAALRALHATVARAISALPNVTAPTLVIQSREDNRIPVEAAQRAFDRIGAVDKQLVWVTGAGHVLTVDYGRDRVFQLVADFLERQRNATPRERRA